MKSLLLVAGGGFLGAVSRYYLTNLIQSKHTRSFPLGTFAVNLTGSLLLGFLFSCYTIYREFYLLIGTGFMGAFTTFSTFALESVELIRKDKLLISLVYLLFSAILGITFAFLGYFIGR